MQEEKFENLHSMLLFLLILPFGENCRKPCAYFGRTLASIGHGGDRSKVADSATLPLVAKHPRISAKHASFLPASCDRSLDADAGKRTILRHNAAAGVEPLKTGPGWKQWPDAAIDRFKRDSQSSARSPRQRSRRLTASKVAEAVAIRNRAVGTCCTIATRRFLAHSSRLGRESATAAIPPTPAVHALHPLLRRV